MRISIAMATWNGTAFLADQLDSLRLQTRQADEVILFDDASTDGTAEFCRAYVEKHGLRGWVVQEASSNEGYKRNFARAIAATTGDWVFLCDQDDRWHPNKLERMEALLRTRPEAGGIAHSFSCIDGENRPISMNTPHDTSNHGLIPFDIQTEVSMFRWKDQTPELLLVRNIAMGCCMGFSRDVCGRFLRLSLHEIPHDWELALGAYCDGGLLYTPEELIDYRLHSHNAIGLPGMAPGHTPTRPSEEGRMKGITEFSAVLRAADAIRADMGQEPIPGDYAAFNALRREMLTSRSLMQWLRLQRYRRIYTVKFSRRQRLGDLYLVLTRRGLSGQ